MRGRVGASVAALLLTALVLPASGCAGCDDVGCLDPAVTLSLTAPIDRFPLTVELCVDGSCIVRSPAPTSGPPAAQPERIDVPLSELGIESLDPDDAFEVTVRMTDRDGVVVLDALDTVRPTRFRAGGDCGPTCTVLDLRY
jgi:hypothetical protein